MIHKKTSMVSFVRTALLALAAVATLTPLYVMGSAALKPSSQASSAQMWELPESLSLQGVQIAWNAVSPNFLNSLMIAVPGTIITSLIGALGGYVFAKLQFRGSRALFAAILLGMFIPYQVILVPLVRFLQATGLFDTLPGLILVHCVYGIPIVILIFRNYFENIPDEIREAGQLDGAGESAMFFRLFLPLSLPGFVVCWIFQFTNIWNDFLFGITAVPDPSTQPVTVALVNLSGNMSVDWNAVMSAALITALPTILLYVFLSRFFIQGLMSGSVK